MGLRISLLDESTLRHGGYVDFRSLLVRNASDYTCQPESLLSHQQVEELSWQLRRLPRLVVGRIGPYRWQEQSDSAPDSI